MKKKQAFVVFISLWYCLTAISQVKIHGKAETYAGEKIHLYTYANFISKNRKDIAQSLIDSTGNFSFNVNIKDTSLYFLQINDIKSMMYLEPGQSYHITFPQFDTTRILLFSEEKWIDVVIHQPENDLNKLIIDFSAQYDAFVKKHLTHFIGKRAKKPVESFEKEVLEKYKDVNNGYFKTWVHSSVATLKLTALMSKQKIYNQYLKNKKIAYSNDAFMDFFNQFYEGYLQDLPAASYHTLVKVANEKMSWKDFKEIIAHHDFVETDTLLELVSIKILYDNFFNKDFRKKGILLLLSQIADATKIPDNRFIALQVKEKLSSIIPGHYAPNFELPSLKNNDTIRLSDFSDKLVLVDFWATWCTPCIKEFSALKKLYEKYKKDLIIISISIDKKRKKAERFVKRKNYPWLFAHFDNHYELTEQYKVRAIPLYYLIGPDGKVILSPAPRSEELDKYLMNILKKKNRRKSSVLDY